MMILRSAGWHISPDDLLHFVLAVKVCRRSHIAMAPLAIFRADDEIEIVLQHWAGWIGPHQGNLERGRQP